MGRLFKRNREVIFLPLFYDYLFIQSMIIPFVIIVMTIYLNEMLLFYKFV